MFDQYSPVEKWETKDLANYITFVNSCILVQMMPREKMAKLTIEEAWTLAFNAIDLYGEVMREIERRKEDYDKNIEALNNLI